MKKIKKIALITIMFIVTPIGFIIYSEEKEMNDCIDKALKSDEGITTRIEGKDFCIYTGKVKHY